MPGQHIGVTGGLWLNGPKSYWSLVIVQSWASWPLIYLLVLAGLQSIDPTVHEALTHAHSADVAEPTCVEVFQPGYRLGDRVVRPARVAVADPEQ